MTNTLIVGSIVTVSDKYTGQVTSAVVLSVSKNQRKVVIAWPQYCTGKLELNYSKEYNHWSDVACNGSKVLRIS